MRYGVRPCGMRRGLRVLAITLLGLSVATAAQAFWIPVKAAVAQVLLEDAWRRSRLGVEAPVPWPWADAWPIAILRAPDSGERLVVLSNASGRSMAFGPGHLSGTSPPGGRGTTIFAGHRDTHFAFLRDVEPGERLLLETREGERHIYVVVETAVVHAGDARVAEETRVDRLALVTCWPFDTIRPGSELRFVVIAERRTPGTS